MLIHSASQLLTIAGRPQKGQDLGDLRMVGDGAVLIQDGKIVEVGLSAALRHKHPEEEQVDAAGRVVMPGFVDPHTHVVWAGDRAAEFEMRLQGKTYLEILEAGGGILSTVMDTRRASLDQLVLETRSRLESMFQHGATTIEAKTGYGLNLEIETRMLEALLRLDDEGPWDLAFTFLGAHAFPPEYADKQDAYTTLLVKEMLPSLKEWWGQNGGGRDLPFVDVFCETGAFNLPQTERILETAMTMGYPIKVHADEFDNLGGTELAVRFGAASADHLVSISQKDIEALASGSTVAVALPGTPFGLAEGTYTPAKDILNAGGLLAIASDLNPGTAWCENIQFALALACRYMKLTPAQAIVASTINAAAAIGMDERVGSVEVGKQADLLILNVRDYRHLGYRFGTNLVHTVIKNGTAYPNK